MKHAVLQIISFRKLRLLQVLVLVVSSYLETNVKAKQLNYFRLISCNVFVQLDYDYICNTADILSSRGNIRNELWR